MEGEGERGGGDDGRNKDNQLLARQEQQKLQGIELCSCLI